jgi:hypothetical protein
MQWKIPHLRGIEAKSGGKRVWLFENFLCRVKIYDEKKVKIHGNLINDKKLVGTNT